jgi:hypothetical protein
MWITEVRDFIHIYPNTINGDFVMELFDLVGPVVLKNTKNRSKINQSK